MAFFIVIIRDYIKTRDYYDDTTSSTTSMEKHVKETNMQLFAPPKR